MTKKKNKDLQVSIQTHQGKILLSDIIGEETWVTISTASGYAFSSLGRIVSFWDSHQRLCNKPQKLLKINYSNKDGYPSIRLTINGSKKTFRVHRLFAEAFCYKLSKYYNQVDHIDRNKLNNNAYNLKWSTSSGNNKNIDSKRQAKIRSKYCGPWFFEDRNKWTVNIYIKGVRKYLGIYDTEEEAAIAYDDYCILNNIDRKINFPQIIFDLGNK